MSLSITALQAALDDEADRLDGHLCAAEWTAALACVAHLRRLLLVVAREYPESVVPAPVASSHNGAGTMVVCGVCAVAHLDGDDHRCPESWGR